jgi:acetyltransferase-like isoleucine patch superfamily enzyme
MKLGPSCIGARATVGNYSTTLYDTKIGEDAALGALSILMKGEELPERTAWEGSPARTVCDLIVPQSIAA